MPRRRELPTSPPGPASDPSENGHGWSPVLSRASDVDRGGGVFALTIELLDGFTRMFPFLPPEEVAELNVFFHRAQEKARDLQGLELKRQDVIIAAVALVRNVERGEGIDSAMSRLHGALLELRDVMGKR